MNNSQSYHKKYLKYKKKYLKLKNENRLKRGTKYNINNKPWMKNPFYFIHSTSFENLLIILNDGYIKSGKSVPEKHIRLGGYPLDFIFASIYFDDIKNITSVPSHSLILSPKILVDYNAGFNEGWVGETDEKTIMLNKNDDKETIEYKLIKIKNILQKSEYAPTHKNISGWHATHEILFFDTIPLKKYLLGVVCYKCNQEELDKINEALKKYGDVYITIKSDPLPKLTDLIID